jgi:beta-galactosidase
MRSLEEMIVQHRNHPSIILWGTRINESPDDDDFYTCTNNIAKALDPSRSTGGIRNFLSSRLIEDVFTYNDFSNTAVAPTCNPPAPHLITENAG